jgi:hypothetical protein
VNTVVQGDNEALRDILAESLRRPTLDANIDLKITTCFSGGEKNN